jgi:pyruvate formate lyase activating enzyme
MKIGGLQKTSLLDYPNMISAIVWTIGCNFRCPFCYNRELVLGNVEEISEQEIFSFLKKRKGMLEALVITGGEPLMNNDITDFIENVKKMKYLVKIDTNGMYPEKLEELIDKNLLDYVSMDVKAPKNKYDKLSGVKTDLDKIEKSIDIIKNSKIDYEFKTTFVPDLLEKRDIIQIAKWLDGSKKYFLQQFKNNTSLISKKLLNTPPHSKEELIETLNEIKPYFQQCDVRGI